MSTVRVSRRAQVDLDEIWLYIAEDNMDAATKLTREIQKRFVTLENQPLLGESRDDVAQGLRQLTVRQRVIFYSYDEPTDTVEIRRILHGARDFASLFQPEDEQIP